MDILEVHKKLCAKEISPVELTEQCLSAAKQSSHNSFISLLEDLAVQTAREAESRIFKQGPKTYLDGIPFSLKDLFLTEGIRTTGGSMILYNYVPAYDGYVSEQLRKAGGVLVGKASCDEFGMGSTNENTCFGSVSHPLDSQFVSGGSSGGSAVNIADGSSFYSIGTDTGGSSRLPANFCGLTALKPTYGRISRYGQIAYASSLDQAAPIARTVSDMACVMKYLTEYDSRDSTNCSLGSLDVVEELVNTREKNLVGKKIGMSGKLIEQCDPQVRASLEKSLQLFREAGATIVELSDFQYLEYSISTYYIIATSEASSNLSQYDGIHYGFRDFHAQDLEQVYKGSRSKGFGPEVKRRILLGTYSLSAGYFDAYYKKACQVRRLIKEEWEEKLRLCDAIFFPVCISTAFPKGQVNKDSIVKMYESDLFTVSVNLAGLPSLALPCGRGENNLPTGFQLIGKPFEEKELLKIGRSFELAYGL